MTGDATLRFILWTLILAMVVLGFLVAPPESCEPAHSTTAPLGLTLGVS